MMPRRTVLAGGGVLLVVTVVGVLVAGPRGGAAAPAPAPASVEWSALPRRVTVEVLNGSGRSGLARVGAVALRRGGLDVVLYANADSASSGKAVTRVLVRRGDTTGVGRIRELLGAIEVVDEPLAARLVDLSVILGRDAFPAPRP